MQRSGSKQPLLASKLSVPGVCQAPSATFIYALEKARMRCIPSFRSLSGVAFETNVCLGDDGPFLSLGERSSFYASLLRVIDVV